ncbi:MAG: glyoxylate reductase [Candidatus Bathyarchaeia archaeon]
MKAKVYITREIPESGIDLLRGCCDIEVNPEQRPPTKEELKRMVRGKDAILCLVTDRIDKDVMAEGPELKVIGSMSVGFEHIDIDEATKRGIYVTNTPGILTDATADFAWTLIMASARRVAEADRYVREQKWKIAWSPMMFLGSEVYGRTLGLVGLGRIGSGVAERSRGFRMRLLYHDIVRASPEKERDLGVEYVPLERLLRESDFVTVHVPLTPETRHLIGKEELRMMKPNAHLINTSRGPVVDEEALILALRERWIAGAGLDVFEKEPIPEDSPLLRLDNVTLAPHIASATRESRYGMAKMAAENILAVLRGGRPPQLVNPEVVNVRPPPEAKVI